ncbi:MAG: PqqD family protein [Acidimicrobiales bacterium]
MTTEPAAVDAIGRDFVARRREGVVSVEIEGDVILYDEERELSHLLNPSGAIIWQLLDGEASLEELVVDLAEAFHVDTGTVESDVLTLVRELGRRGLIENVVGDPDAGASLEPFAR